MCTCIINARVLWFFLSLIFQYCNFRENSTLWRSIPLLCRIPSLPILYIAPRWKEKHASWVELIFIVKHNNIHLLLPHLLHVDSIVKSAEVHRILTLESSKRTKMISSCPHILFTCQPVKHGVYEKYFGISHSIAFAFRKSGSAFQKRHLDVLTNQMNVTTAA